MTERLPLVLSLVFFTLVSGGLILTHALLGTDLSPVISEDGIIEMLSVVLWLIVFAGCLIMAISNSGNRINWLLGGVIVLLFAMRELDAQKWLIGWNIGKPASYWDAGIPLNQRILIAMFVVLPAMIAILLFIYRMWSQYIQTWSYRVAWKHDLVYWLIMLIVSTRLDKFHHYMPALGLDPRYHYIFLVMEEVLEMILALYVLLMLLSLWFRRRVE